MSAFDERHCPVFGRPWQQAPPATDTMGSGSPWVAPLRGRNSGMGRCPSLPLGLSVGEVERGRCRTDSHQPSKRATPDRRRRRGKLALNSAARRLSQCSLQGRIKRAEKPGAVLLGQRSWCAGIRSELPEVPRYFATDECVAYIIARPSSIRCLRASHLFPRSGPKMFRGPYLSY
jgi:hypothetical protein